MLAASSPKYQDPKYILVIFFLFVNVSFVVSLLGLVVFVFVVFSFLLP